MALQMEGPLGPTQAPGWVAQTSKIEESLLSLLAASMNVQSPLRQSETKHSKLKQLKSHHLCLFEASHKYINT